MLANADRLPISKTGIVEFNGGVRMLIWRSETAVCAHAQYNFDDNSP